MPAKRRKDNGKGSREQNHPNAMRGSGAGGMRGSAMHATPGMSGGTSMPGGGRAGGDNEGRPNAMAGRPGQGQAMQTGRVGGGGGGAGGAGGPEPPRRRTCGTQDVHRRLLIESAEYRAARAEIENATMERLALAPEARFAGVARIPVVVHVVWNTAAQNISAAQITSQIDVLNHDFRATNADVANVPSVFAGLVADARIEFFLATTDPSGNPTNGITRTSTNQASFSDDDAVKSSATGGADPWPADRYLNMWVCLLGGGLLGYAQFPGGPAQTDGVVITHTAFGTTGTAAAPFHLGRTATHEIGHYLNLFHIWGDDGSGCTGSDQVADTPNQGGPNFGCPTFPHVSCNNGPNGDLFMDYMDYVDDACMVMFTHGQAVRMEACIDTVRTSLPLFAGRPTPSGPVVSWASDRIDAFVIGTDRALYHKWWDGSSWGPSVTDYEYMGGVCFSPPRVAAWGENRLDVFVISSDSALYHKWWDGSSWGPSVIDYEYLGGVCSSPPEVVAWGENRLDLFVLGTDHALYHKWWDGSSWGPSVTDWEYMGGVCTSQPTVVSWGPDRLDVFVTGTDSALYHKWWDGSSWGPSVTDYEYLGGVCTSRPRVTAWGPNRLDVFVTGTDSALYHKWWDGSSWGPSVTDYEYMGGVITAFRLGALEEAAEPPPAPPEAAEVTVAR
jgi:hypothetical protein